MFPFNSNGEERGQVTYYVLSVVGIEKDKYPVFLVTYARCPDSGTARVYARVRVEDGALGEISLNSRRSSYRIDFSQTGNQFHRKLVTVDPQFQRLLRKMAS